jgi:hypothetical protein
MKEIDRGSSKHSSTEQDSSSTPGLEGRTSMPELPEQGTPPVGRASINPQTRREQAYKDIYKYLLSAAVTMLRRPDGDTPDDAPNGSTDDAQGSMP